MCPRRTSQVVGKEHSAEARVEWVHKGVKSNQYWSHRGAVLVTNVYQYWSMQCPVLLHFPHLGGQGAVSVAICLCDSGLSSGAKAS